MKNSKKTYIQERLNNLIALKDLYLLQNKSEIWKNKANMKEAINPDDNDFRTQISVTVKMTKDADLLSAQPEWTFIPLDEEGRRNRKMIKYIWDYYWLVSNTDEAISNTIQSATTYGTGILFDGIKHIRQTVKKPYYELDEDGNMSGINFKEEKILKYSGIWSEQIPFQNFFINGTDIKNSTEAIVIRYFDKDEYVAEKLEDGGFNKEAILQVKETTGNNNTVVNNTIGDKYDETTVNNTVLELEYWNIARDEYIVEANGIEVKNTPIPYPHKLLPFSLYMDNKGDGRIWGIGEFELLEQEERYKNELRTLLVRGVKSSIGLILKDRGSEIEEDELSYGIGEVYETDDINGLKQFAPNVPIGAISEAESRIDNDIISKSGVDFKSQLLSSGETATKTQGKDKSAQKRINKNIKDNAWGFYRRLAEIRMENIQFLHSIGNKEIPIEGGTVNLEGVFTSETGGYGSAVITKDLVKGKFTVLPIVETMLGDSKERKRQDAIQYAQLVGNMAEQDGTRPVKATQLAKLITEEFDYDFEKLTEQDETGKTPKSILKDFNLKTNGTKGTEQDPNYVPPEQRNLIQGVPTLSGMQKTSL